MERGRARSGDGVSEKSRRGEQKKKEGDGGGGSKEMIPFLSHRLQQFQVPT